MDYGGILHNNKSISPKIEDQKHLNYTDTINLGAYYTNFDSVKIVYNFLNTNIKNIKDYTIIDTSCGYGSFLEYNNIDVKYIGADIDIKAIEIAKKKHHKNTNFFNINALLNVERKNYGLNIDDRIIIVGNPPYNDTTSMVRNSVKILPMEVDSDLKTRDLGVSFLLSYNKIQADYICVLHPLSYLIKKSNFNLLKNFTKHYRLKDSVIISSNSFNQTSKFTSFPIIIAFYEKNSQGMDYNFVTGYQFKTLENKNFIIKNFENIINYIHKYPNQKLINSKKAVAFFWTMRDINALKRNKTFMEKITDNTVFITKDNLDYYCYVDIFKEYTKYIPYYFGNCDIFIDNNEFLKIKHLFRFLSLKKYPYLTYLLEEEYDEVKSRQIVDNYFKKLLGEHFVY
jgi:hypothetical protein